MVNKKNLFLILLVASTLSVACCAYAAEASTITIMTAVQTAATNIGIPMIIVGWLIAGILYLSSAGSANLTGLAKKALISCVIGTVLVILAANACGFINSLFGLGGSCTGGAAAVDPNSGE